MIDEYIALLSDGELIELCEEILREIESRFMYYSDDDPDN